MQTLTHLSTILKSNTTGIAPAARQSYIDRRVGLSPGGWKQYHERCVIAHEPAKLSGSWSMYLRPVCVCVCASGGWVGIGDVCVRGSRLRVSELAGGKQATKKTGPCS